MDDSLLSSSYLLSLPTRSVLMTDLSCQQSPQILYPVLLVCVFLFHYMLFLGCVAITIAHLTITIYYFPPESLHSHTKIFPSFYIDHKFHNCSPWFHPDAVYLYLHRLQFLLICNCARNCDNLETILPGTVVINQMDDKQRNFKHCCSYPDLNEDVDSSVRPPSVVIKVERSYLSEVNITIS